MKPTTNKDQVQTQTTTISPATRRVSILLNYAVTRQRLFAKNTNEMTCAMNIEIFVLEI